MKVQLKSLKDQVVVLTGASSGIGLATARMAARRGARLVLAARNEDALRRLAEEIRVGGGQAVYVVADVGNEAEVQEIARTALAEFGGFDTWINDAGTSIFGRLLDISTEDHRRLFETNFWGMVYGSLAAARHLSERGGALINVGSVVSDRAVPLQGMYSASKHAVKGFTDALRMELEAAGAPVSVTLIKPTSINTPFPQHSRNYLPEEPDLPSPLYAPELVAEAILHCAEHPRRDMIVGGAGKLISMSGFRGPRVADRVMETSGFLKQQQSGRPPQNPAGALHSPTFGLQERGETTHRVRETSLYTTASMHPFVTGAFIVGAGVLVGALLNRGGTDGRNGTRDAAPADGSIQAAGDGPGSAGMSRPQPAASRSVQGAGPAGTASRPPGEGAFGNTLREHTVVPEAKWGVTSGTPSGGIAGGTPAQEVPSPDRDAA